MVLNQLESRAPLAVLRPSSWIAAAVAAGILVGCGPSPKMPPAEGDANWPNQMDTASAAPLDGTGGGVSTDASVDGAWPQGEDVDSAAEDGSARVVPDAQVGSADTTLDAALKDTLSDGGGSSDTAADLGSLPGADVTGSVDAANSPEPDAIADTQAATDAIGGTAGDTVANCQAQPEICNGLDDNCDGKTDNGLSPSSCDDGADCTVDYCWAGQCQNDADDTKCLLQSDACVVTKTLPSKCIPFKGCSAAFLPAGTPCTPQIAEAAWCNQYTCTASGACLATGLSNCEAAAKLKFGPCFTAATLACANAPLECGPAEVLADGTPCGVGLTCVGGKCG